MKNKYLVFLYEDYYPFGGLEDFIGGVADLSEVSDLIRSNTGDDKRRRLRAGEDKRLAYSELTCNILCTETGDFLTLDRLGGEFKKAGSALDGFVEAECDSEATEDAKAFKPPSPPTHAWSALTGEQVPIYQPGKGGIVSGPHGSLIGYGAEYALSYDKIKEALGAQADVVTVTGKDLKALIDSVVPGQQAKMIHAYPTDKEFLEHSGLGKLLSEEE
jgi:hypothetical protein